MPDVNQDALDTIFLEARTRNGWQAKPMPQALLEEIWESLDPASSAVPSPAWHEDELRKRVAAFEKDGNRGRPADEVFAELKRTL